MRSTSSDELQRVAGRDDVIVHDPHRILPLAHVQSGERAPGAADGVEGAAVETVERLDLLQRVAGDLGRLLRRTIGKLDQRQAAERQGHAVADLAAGDVGEFERAAAEIADHPVGRPDRRGDAETPRAAPRAGRSAGRSRSRSPAPPVRGTADRWRRRAPPRWRPRGCWRCPSSGTATRKRCSAASALAVASSDRKPVVATPRPSPHSTFSLKIGVSARLSDLVGDEADRVRPDVDDRHRLARQPSSCFQPSTFNPSCSSSPPSAARGRRGRFCASVAQLAIGERARARLGQRPAAPRQARMGEEILVGVERLLAFGGRRSCTLEPSGSTRKLCSLSSRLASMIWLRTCSWTVGLSTGASASTRRSRLRCIRSAEEI